MTQARTPRARKPATPVAPTREEIASNAARKAWATRRARAQAANVAPVTKRETVASSAARKAWVSRRIAETVKPEYQDELLLILASLRRIERAMDI